MAKVSKRLRYEILRRDNYRCRYCGAGAPDVELRVDHVTPDALGGATEPSNLVTACEPCNSGKSSTTPDAPVVDEVQQDALRWSQAIKAAAASLEADLEVGSREDEWFQAAWGAWTFVGTDRPVPLPHDWSSSVRRLRTAGLTEPLLEDAIDTAMQAPNVRPENVFRYFCGVGWRTVGQLHDRAQGIVAASSQPEQLLHDPRDLAANHIAAALDRALDHTGIHLDPWLYDELVLQLEKTLTERV